MSITMDPNDLWRDSYGTGSPDWSDHSQNDFLINPTTGLPMTDGIGSLDVGGHLFCGGGFHTWD